MPHEWGKRRIYPASSGVPGPRDPHLTPYMIPWAEAVGMGTSALTIMVCGAQMGKTDTQLDIMGERLDTRPVPILYVGPSKEFNEGQFSPRFDEMLTQAKGLGAKASKKRQKLTLKRIAGVRVRFAHAGSSTALKSDPAGLALVDEVDEMLANVKKQGDPMGLIAARGFTYADFSIAAASTPSMGVVDSEVDMASGLEFWKECPPEDLESRIWAMWQKGTMHHWAWPCPHCEEYFVPRMKLLKYPEDATAAKVRRNTALECPNCGADIVDEIDGDNKGKTKAWMNARGLMVARGQWIENGVVKGEPANESDTMSFWVSGLASPFVSWGERAAAVVEAKGDPDEEQTAINAGGGECYAPGGGDVPPWKEILQLRRPYQGVPKEAILLTAGVDIQKNSIFAVVRAWGPRGTSWLIHREQLHGDTSQPEVWQDLHDLLTQKFDGMVIKIAFIDSGFRPGKPFVVPVNMVYAFVRGHSRFCYATKGHDVQTVPIKRAKIEVQPHGGVAKYGMELMHLDSDFFKRLVHERLSWKQETHGAFYLDETADEAYARQLVSEVRVIVKGKPVWVRKSRDNHYLDCEALAGAAGYFLNVHRIGVNARRKAKDDEVEEDEAAPTEVALPAPAAAVAAQASSKDAMGNKFARMAAMMNRPRG